MKRYSLAYVGVLVLAAFGTMLLLPKGLDAEEFLAKASEQYESTEGIFHEERLNQSYENDVLVTSWTEEVWLDAEGNMLQTMKDADGVLVDVSMDKMDGNGTGNSYFTPEKLAEMGGMSNWEEIFSGNKYICVQSEIQDGMDLRAMLNIAEEDPTVYAVNGYSESINGEMSPRESLLSGNNSAAVVKQLLEEIENDKSDNQKAYQEGDYLVFEWTTNTYDDDGDHSQTIYTYFNTESYALEMQKVVSAADPTHYDIATYLAHEFLPSDQASEIFNPEKYGLVMGPGMVMGGSSLAENGCYFGESKLSEEEEQALLDSLPLKAIQEWEEMFASMKGEEPVNTSLSTEQTEEINNVELPEGMSFIRPTTGNITQGYHAGHYAYDIADENKPDILAVAGGTVVDTGVIGGWNGGYGNYVRIDHGNGVFTMYANCEEIYVKEGDTVSQGDVIAKMGNTGRAYGPTGIHTHFELIVGDKKVNPAIMNVW